MLFRGNSFGYETHQFGKARLIPKTIHQLWIDPDAESSPQKSTRVEPPPDIEWRCAKWRLLHPSFTYRLWSLEDVAEVIEHDDGLGVRALLAIRSLRFPAAKADIARLIVLRRFGGFWVDLKLEPRASFLNPLVDFDLVLTEHFPQYHRPEPNGFLVNSFIGSDRQTSFLNHVLERVTTNVEKRMKASIFDVTGSPSLFVIRTEMEKNGEPIGNYTVLSHRQAWNEFFTMGPASYNNNRMHWSSRELHEPIYEDNELA
jgi:mannosyltransferase OCH1-like enzyme